MHVRSKRAGQGEEARTTSAEEAARVEAAGQPLLCDCYHPVSCIRGSLSVPRARKPLFATLFEKLHCLKSDWEVFSLFHQWQGMAHGVCAGPALTSDSCNRIRNDRPVGLAVGRGSF